jgi:hypothetical protein
MRMPALCEPPDAPQKKVDNDIREQVLFETGSFPGQPPKFWIAFF